jgi:hypothetical protein
MRSVATRTGSSAPDAWRIAASAEVRNDWTGEWGDVTSGNLTVLISD